MTKFKSVEPKNLIEKKKYLTIEILENPNYGYSHHRLKGNITNLIYGSYIDVLCGRIDHIYFDKNKNITEVCFYELVSVLTGKISSRTFLYITNTLFFECLTQKEIIQKNMEERNLRDIMRNIIGDDKFTHYLFEDHAMNHQIEVISDTPFNISERPILETDISETNILYRDIEEYLE